MDYIGLQESEDGRMMHTYVAFIAPLDGSDLPTLLEILVNERQIESAQFFLDQTCMQTGMYELHSPQTRH